MFFYGEHGWTDLGGMHSMSDLVEYTSRYRKRPTSQRLDWNDMINDEIEKVSEKELEWCKYPDDQSINKVGLRGIFIGNYDPWDANEHTKLVKKDINGKKTLKILIERTDGFLI